MGYAVLFLALLSFSLVKENTAADDKVPYVVYLGQAPSRLAGINPVLQYLRVASSHLDLLGSILGTRTAANDSIFYSYTQNINGFAAILDKATADKISKLSEVVSVFPSRAYDLQTTRSWQFLGLESDGFVGPNSLWCKAEYGKNTIIGTLDTGVWPESESFADDGMGDIPSEWKGICQNDVDKSFTCNKKLIGARYFNKGYQARVGQLNSSYMTPRDEDGHGTHTLSTAGGAFVANASLFGHGSGTAKGGCPHARVASYKVCWPPVNGGGSCYDTDILAAFDAAISDGVHVLSVSLGSPPHDYLNDGIAIGSFHAVKNGIKVICSAGNSGPEAGTVSNVAPWIFTVAASTMDREFPAYLYFGDRNLKGQSLASTSLTQGKYPIISSTDAEAANSTALDAQVCIPGSLDSTKVNGSIVICTSGTIARVEKGEAVLQAGGVGMVIINTARSDNMIIPDAHVLPATHLTYSDGQTLLSYLKTNSKVLGYVTKPETVLYAKPAPFMASFSSRGPNTITPGILKPDITAPGVSVIAAYSEATSATGLYFDKRHVKFNIISGTSMACPHTSGIVGLLHSLYPEWSPAAIRSAIMTTASVTDNKGEKILTSTSTATPFSYGSGHVNPNTAADPGLIYDLNTTDYLNFLCSIGYTARQVASFQQGYQCPSQRLRIYDFNYPSFTIYNLTSSVTISRTVKNVGPPSIYTVKIEEPSGISVKVEPSSLKFDASEEKKFNVTFTVTYPSSDYVFGSITWSDGLHFVRSPVVVLTSS
ncbi:Subtilisin-like protease [Rhynchospora pubera]|uniref:Subtilisin-like protease n=1 Tax=Rhynchospora pubera TaxID=906938 RepID=A0AAV8EZX0_9POAL|nr:Subtilisin-like protease [Rhynchospora pubera]